jgi:hypothetical protein
VQTIKKNQHYFLHQKTYGQNYPDDWSDEQKKETKTGIASGLEQLKEQVFILIDQNEKHIYSSLESAKRTNSIIENLLEINLNIFHRLVEIEEFESKNHQTNRNNY